MFFDYVAALLIVLAGLNVGSTVILVMAALRHRWAALEERATVAVILALIAIGAATLGLNRLRILNLPPEVGIGILTIGLILVSAPSLIWLRSIPNAVWRCFSMSGVRVGHSTLPCATPSVSR